MSKNRDEFARMTSERLARRARYVCSRPDCRIATVGPSDEDESAVSNIGRAAHIHAAAPGGPRYDPAMDRAQRSHISNGIWLCANHAAEVDTDTRRFPADLLRGWKREHERWIQSQLGLPSSIGDARARAFEHWCNRIRVLLETNRASSTFPRPDGTHEPRIVIRFIASSERSWAERAIAADRLKWMDSGKGLIGLPDESMTVHPAHPHEPVHLVLLNPGTFDDPPFESFEKVVHRPTPTTVLFEFRPPSGFVWNWRLGYLRQGPTPYVRGVGSVGGVTEISSDDLEERIVSVQGTDYIVFDVPKPASSNLSIYLGFRDRYSSQLVYGVAPGPGKDPADWKRVTVGSAKAVATDVIGPNPPATSPDRGT